MRTPLFVLAVVLLGACEARSTAEKVETPPVQVVSTSHQKKIQPQLEQPMPAAKATWHDRITGQDYPLPASIAGKPITFYLQSKQVSPLAKAFYAGRFRPTDNDSTTQLLALVTTNNQEIRPFYRWCLDFTIVISDGALGEYPGEPALAYATKFPQEFFAYMDKDKTGNRYKRWVESIAYSGLSAYDTPVSEIQQAITRDMSKSCYPCSSGTSRRIADFGKDITAATQNN